MKSESNDKLKMIGQFGVGFYSAFLVANSVQVLTKGCDEKDEYLIWESDTTKYTISELKERPEHSEPIYSTLNLDDSYILPFKRGTWIRLFMKDDAEQYLDNEQIKTIITKHSRFINYPIELFVEKEEKVDIDEEDENEEDEEKDVTIEDVKDVEDGNKVETQTVQTWELVNKSKPIWSKSPDDVTKEEYNSFYKDISSDWQDFLVHKHFKVEGSLGLESILFTPEKPPFDLAQNKKPNNIKLYVRRVFITDDCREFVPEYLNFVSGVIDSEDLPLTISREMLQQNSIMKTITKTITKKCIEMFGDLMEEDMEKYKKFFQNFSKHLKLGVHTDDKNRDKLLNLMMYTSSKHNEPISLKQYVEEMKEGQNQIYYITGETVDKVKNSPFLEALVKKDYDVLFMVESIDEFVMNQVKKFQEKDFKSIVKGDLDLSKSDEEKKKHDDQKTRFEELAKFVKEVLSDKVEKVTISDRQLSVPAVLSTGQFGYSANMERLMKAQAMGGDDPMMMMYMMGKKNMELNPDHKILSYMNERYQKDKQDKTVKDMIQLIFETSLIDSGFTLEKPTDFTKRIHRMIELGLSMDGEEDEKDEECIDNYLQDLEKAEDNNPEFDSKLEEMEAVD
jgi:molecular chaperone HtpG